MVCSQLRQTVFSLCTPEFAWDADRAHRSCGDPGRRLPARHLASAPELYLCNRRWVKKVVQRSCGDANRAELIVLGDLTSMSIAKIPSALKPLTLASPAGRLPNHDGRTDFVVFVSEIRA